MPDRNEPQEVVDLALEPAGCEGAQRERRKPRLARRNRHQRGQLRAAPRRREDVRQREVTGAVARVCGAEQLHLESELGDPVGYGGQVLA